MKVAISSAGPELSSPVDPRFGRCAYLIFYDTDTGEWEALPNANMNAGGGAGIRTAQTVLDKGAQAVVTGNMGPNATRVLSGQTKVHTGFSGTVEEAIRSLQAGGLTETTAPTVDEHAGLTEEDSNENIFPAPGGPQGTMGNPGGWRCGRGWGRGRGPGGGHW